MRNRTYLPMELVDVEPVRIKKITEEQRAAMCRVSTLSSLEYQKSINNIRQDPKKRRFENDPFVAAWNMNIDVKMITVPGRILPMPDIVYTKSYRVTRDSVRDPGTWNMRQTRFHTPGKFPSIWAIINLSSLNQEVCVYDWVDLIKSNLDYQWNFDPEQPNEKTDPRALNSYSNDSLDKIYEYLIEYNKEYAEKQFENHLQTCLICAETLPGKDCFRLHRCGHFYCRSCLNHYIQSTLNDGKFGERLVCPEGDCRQAILPTEVKEIVGDDKLYERYERITLEKGLAMMNDIIWRPR